VGVSDLGFPLWLLISVLIVFAVLLYYMLRGRVSERLRAPLALVLAPVCTVAAVPVLRSADRSSGAAAQDIAGVYPKHHTSGDDRPHRISDIVSDGVPNGLPERFTVSLCDGDAVRACQSACRQVKPGDMLT
jgi:hypothetical protein